MVEGEIRFGRFRLDLARRRLRRDETVVRLGSRAIDILGVLASAGGKVVTKDELMARVWAGAVVEENNLHVHISALRKALEDDRNGESWIVTVPGRGYRFVRPQTPPAAAGDPAPEQSFPAADTPSLAVLAFQSLSGDPEQEYFADGMVEEIITALSRIRWLFVTARNSSFAYKGRNVDVRSVGRELGVRYVIEGSVRRSGDRVRITAQLIDASSGTHLWADTFDGSMEDGFELQDRVASSIAGVIEPTLEAADIRRSGERPTRDGALSSSWVDPASDAGPIRHPAAEQRQITALSGELVDASPAADDVDLEDWREVVGDFRRLVSNVVNRHEGSVCRYLGDTALALFGYPEAHEHDAEEAIRAGLELCAAVRTLRPHADVPMRCRIGIATGLVIVGEPAGVGATPDAEIVGDAPSLATRLQVSAEFDSVVIDPVTRRAIGNLFDCRAIDADPASKPTRRWQVLGESAIESRFEASRGPTLTPLVGRDEELDLLWRRWTRAKTGDGQVVLVSGEPGIGKSRITAALEERLDAEPHLRLRYFCSPYHPESALFPFVEELTHAAGFVRDDPPAARWDKLEATLAIGSPPDEDVALLADLLSLPASERHPLPTLGPQRKKDRTGEALIRRLEGPARCAPTVVIFEDAQWIDPSSRDLLDLTIERIRSLPVLLIVTFRPEFQPPWTGQERVSTLAINRLDRQDRAVLIERIAGGKALPEDVVAQIVERTDGVPLFVEELTKSVLESGLLRQEANRYVLDGPLPALAIPTSLHASLMARLDRLASVRHVAQVGGAIGRQFPYWLLRTVCRLAADELHGSLARLVASELVSQRGMPPDSVYSFKHALVRDAVHGSLLRNTRQQLHADIAKALEAHSPEIMESQPELLAQHYAEAGLVEEAVAYWSKAGRRSAARSAMAEAAAQFHKGLDQLALLPDSPERRRHELEFRFGLAVVLQAVKGDGASETGRAYARALELWEHLGSPSEFLHVPWGKSRYHIYRGEFGPALRLAEKVLRLSRKNNDFTGLVLGHYSAGHNLLLTGRFALSRSHLEEVLALYDPIAHGFLVHQTGHHLQVNARSLLGMVLFYLGCPDQAVAQSEAAIAEARNLAHPPSLAAILSNDSRLLSLAGADAALSERADELVALAADRGFPFWGVMGALYHGWVKVKRGDVAGGLSLLRSGSTAYRAAGVEMGAPYFLALLAQALEIAGQFEEAMSHMDDALESVEKTGARWFAAELHRLKGQLLLRHGRSEAAEGCYRTALGIAREQGAKLWELRAAVSLARLRRDQGLPTAACDLLAPVYNWFTEGFGTSDLQDAKALLDELAGEPGACPSWGQCV